MRTDNSKHLFEEFKSFLEAHEITPTFTFFYTGEDGPHKSPSFSVHLMGSNPTRDTPQEGGSNKAIHQLGVALAWLSLNKHGLNMLVHPNVAKPFGEVEQEIIDHTQRAIWLLNDPPLKDHTSMEFFHTFQMTLIT